MKKILLNICAFFGLFSTLTLQAQDGLDFGFTAGGNYATYKYVGDRDIYADYDGGFGFYAGAFVSVPVGVKLSFAPELLFSYQTASADGDVNDLLDLLDYQIPITINGEVNVQATEMIVAAPLMFRLKLSRFDVAIGPQISYALDRSMDATAAIEGMDINLDGVDVEDFYEEEDRDKLGLNLNLDAGFYLTKKLKLGARYSYGVLIRDELKSSVVQLGLTYGLL
ncbi:porin family protein [Neptunitalea lumnitzerae]|uniref:Outer membrane protein beta-barrel domain-containing protein n=1 Tax=Neptunitalea lumnitzerae TaxID=2965509 RepID=A0ABQ5MEC9_9FLAO|nr:porin family protein [Neptunitalea sp. Y10]GLB47713.1 hypothetical protein Y10_00810 [Neptunitalea sp. Y10]